MPFFLEQHKTLTYRGNCKEELIKMILTGLHAVLSDIESGGHMKE